MRKKNPSASGELVRRIVRTIVLRMHPELRRDFSFLWKYIEMNRQQFKSIAAGAKRIQAATAMAGMAGPAVKAAIADLLLVRLIIEKVCEQMVKRHVGISVARYTPLELLATACAEVCAPCDERRMKTAITPVIQDICAVAKGVGVSVGDGQMSETEPRIPDELQLKFYQCLGIVPRDVPVVMLILRHKGDVKLKHLQEAAGVNYKGTVSRVDRLTETIAKKTAHPFADDNYSSKPQYIDVQVRQWMAQDREFQSLVRKLDQYYS